MASRFQLVPGAAMDRPSLQRWPAEWAASLPEGLGWSFAHHSPESTKLSTAWRLIGGNNRELGRSSCTYPDVAACREAVAFLREHIDEAKSLLAISNDTGLWTWRLDIGNLWMAVAGRSYQRRRECQYNVARFVAEVPTALLSSDVLGRSKVRDIQRLIPLYPNLEPA